MLIAAIAPSYTGLVYSLVLLSALRLWDASGFTVSSGLSTPLIDQLSSDSLVMHSSTALALGVWLDNHESQASAILDRLIATYKEKKTVPPPKTDSFGRLVVTEYR